LRGLREKNSLKLKAALFVLICLKIPRPYL
jgi:hypothetical protein